MTVQKSIALIMYLAAIALFFGKDIKTAELGRELRMIEKDMETLYVDKRDVSRSRSYPKELVDRIERISKEFPQDIADSLNTPLEASVYCTEILNNDFSEITKELEHLKPRIAGKKKRYSFEAYLSLRDSMANQVPMKSSEIFKAKKGKCRHAVVAAAKILEKKVDPYMLFLSAPPYKKGHCVLVYKNQNGNFGSIGINKSDNNPPIYMSIEDLARGINARRSSSSKMERGLEIIYICPVSEGYPDFDK